MFRSDHFEFVLNQLQKGSIGTGFWLVNAFLNIVCYCESCKL